MCRIVLRVCCLIYILRLMNHLMIFFHIIVEFIFVGLIDKLWICFSLIIFIIYLQLFNLIVFVLVIHDRLILNYSKYSGKILY